MAVERIKWHIKGFKALRKSREVTSDLLRRAKAIQATAGEGYMASPFTGRTRGRASVITETEEARADNARNNTLIRAIDSGR